MGAFIVLGSSLDKDVSRIANDPLRRNSILVECSPASVADLGTKTPVSYQKFQDVGLLKLAGLPLTPERNKLDDILSSTP